MVPPTTGRSCVDPQLRVELAGAVERGHVVAAADMLAADKDLRHRRAPAGPADHFVAPRWLLDNVDFGVIDALALQQRPRPRAIRAEHRRIDLDLRHPSLRVEFGPSFRGSHMAPMTRYGK